MPAPEALEVRLFGLRVGTLTRAGPFNAVLRYDADWVSSPIGVPVSTSLPLATREHRGQRVTDFLDNLLPDHEGVRELWATNAGLGSTEPFLLLSEYGRDVAGALEFVQIGDSTEARTLRHVDDHAIELRLAGLRADTTAWLQGADDVGRFSLAGAQSKFALAHHDGAWYEPSGVAPATHIFKPVVDRLEDGEVVEYLMMRTAAAIGISCAAVDLRWFGAQRTLIVERFDRIRGDDGHVERLHQEDLLQALGRPRLQKYEMHGGPTYRDVLRVLDDGWPDEARASKQSFIRALTFSWLVLNTDAHAKNYAVLLDPGSVRMAPLYDVSSYLPYLPAGSRPVQEAAMADAVLSMSVLGSYHAGDLRAEAWRTVARDAGLDPEQHLQWVRDLCERIADVLQEEIRALDARDRGDVVERLNRRIRVRATQALRSITE